MEKPTTLGAEYLLPHERGGEQLGGDHEVVSALFDALGSEEEQPEGSDESKPKAKAGGEPADDDEGPEGSPAAAAEESEDEGSDDSDEEEPEGRSEQRFKLDGIDEEVTLDELKRGYLRTADYTRKTQAAAEERRKLEAKAAEAAGVRGQYEEKLGAVEEFLRQSQPQEPDWDTLRRQNPDEFAARFAEHQLHKRRLDAVTAERARVAAEREQEQLEVFQARVAEEALKLEAAIPEWKDPKVAAEGKRELVEFLGELGYAREEIEQVADHRILLLVRDALRWRKHQQKAPEVKERIREKVKATELQKPGARTPTSPTQKSRREHERRMKRLAQSGSVDDAAATIMGMLD